MIKYETHTNYELRMLGLLRSTGAICDIHKSDCLTCSFSKMVEMVP